MKKAEAPLLGTTEGNGFQNSCRTVNSLEEGGPQPAGSEQISL